jgi:hypothetical protein
MMDALLKFSGDSHIMLSCKKPDKLEISASPNQICRGFNLGNKAGVPRESCDPG